MKALPPVIAELVNQVGPFWVVGGYVRRQIEGSPINDCDIDIWTANPVDWVQRFGATRGPNESMYFDFKGRQFNVLRLDAESVGIVLKGFDFTCCQIAHHTDGGTMEIGTAVEDIGRRVLVPTVYLINKSTLDHIERSLVRVGRFLSEGYTITRSDLVDVIDRYKSLKFPGKKGGS